MEEEKKQAVRRVLLVEDEEFYRKMYQLKFEKSGFVVGVAVNGDEGLKLAKEFKPDIILLDIVMPVMDGFEALAQIKSQEDLKSIPVVMMTNLSSDADKEKAIKAGAVDYWVKADLTPAETVEKVGNLLVKK